MTDRTPGPIDLERIERDLRTPECRTIEGTLDYITRTLGGAVYIEDAHGRLLFAPTDASADDWREEFTPLSTPTHSGFRTVIGRWRQAGAATVSLLADLSLDYPRAVIPLTYHGRIFAFVHFVRSILPAPVPREENPASRIVYLFGDKLYILLMGIQNEYRDRGPRVPSPAPGFSDPQTSAEADRASRVDCGPGTPEFCLVVRFSNPVGEDRDREVDYPSIVRRVGMVLGAELATSPTGFDVRVAETDEHLLLTLRIDRGAHEETPTNDSGLAELAEELRVLCLRFGWNLRVGVAEVDPADPEAARREAWTMLGLAPADATGPVIMTRDHQDELSLTLIASDVGQFRRLTAFVRDTLREADPVLYETAEAYARRECAVSATASALNVDRRTVNYRLRKIAELTGLDLPSFPSKVILYLAFLPE